MLRRQRSRAGGCSCGAGGVVGAAGTDVDAAGVAGGDGVASAGAGGDGVVAWDWGVVAARVLATGLGVEVAVGIGAPNGVWLEGA